VKPGPKEKPAALKLMAGNPGKRPLKESITPNGKAVEPPGLGDHGKSVWKDLVEMLGPLNLLSRADSRMAFLYCQAWDDYYATSETIDEKGFYSINQQGAQCVAPWVKIRDAAIERIRKLSAEFGLSPSARSGLNISPPKTDTLDSYKVG